MLTKKITLTSGQAVEAALTVTELRVRSDWIGWTLTAWPEAEEAARDARIACPIAAFEFTAQRPFAALEPVFAGVTALLLERVRAQDRATASEVSGIGDWTGSASKLHAQVITENGVQTRTLYPRNADDLAIAAKVDAAFDGTVIALENEIMTRAGWSDALRYTSQKPRL